MAKSGGGLKISILECQIRKYCGVLTKFTSQPTQTRKEHGWFSWSPFERRRYEYGSTSTKSNPNNSNKSQASNTEKVEGGPSGEQTSTYDPKDGCCIYEVPRDLRRLNKEAYTPQMVSIGPIHRDTQHLCKMNDVKDKFKKQFLDRTGNENVMEQFTLYITRKKEKIRACYDHDDSDFLNKFIIMDVIFIFELFLMNYSEKSERGFDFLLDTPKFKAIVKRDLQLLENQIPYFVFKDLFKVLPDYLWPAKPEPETDQFLILALRFFYDRKQDHSTCPTQNLRHFTDLGRHFLVENFQPPEEKVRDGPGEKASDGPICIPCATKLRASGVVFARCDEKGTSPIQIQVQVRSKPLKQIKLKIPKFLVNNDTEWFLRNVMAFEQLHYPEKSHVCNFVIMMDFLIDSEKDVDLLVEKGILSNLAGDNEAVMKMFNRLGLLHYVMPSHSCYIDGAEELKAHYKKRWNHFWVTLRSVYFKDPWTGTGTVVAFVVLFLTIIQTVCSFLQIKNEKRKVEQPGKYIQDQQHPAKINNSKG